MVVAALQCSCVALHSGPQASVWTPLAHLLPLQVHAVLQSVSPGIPSAWWDRWTPDTPASCRLPAQTTDVEAVDVPPMLAGGGSPMATTLYGSTASSRRLASGAAGVQCSMGTLFLQHYLDNLGALNTFG